MVPRQHWADYKINIDVSLAKRVVSLLRDQDFPDVEEDPDFDWHDDTVTPAKWMFPEGTPPATVISMNARFDPVFHVRIGQAISSLRKEGILIIGTGSSVHNLYRPFPLSFSSPLLLLCSSLSDVLLLLSGNNWLPMRYGGDNFQVGSIPAKWATDFERALSDCIRDNKV